jgi:hypothetical protein
MKQICAWCQMKIIATGEKTAAEDLVSHGICPACYENQMKDIDEHLEKLNKLPNISV